MKFYLILLTLIIPTMGSAQESSINGNIIRLVDALDEPEFYCIDLAGWREGIKLNDPLQTHTCKSRNADDQMFYFESNRIKVSHYEGCLEAPGSGGVTLSGSSVLIRPCLDNSNLQDMVLQKSGKIELLNSGFCLIAGEDSVPDSGPSHMWRTLTFSECNTSSPSLSTWQIGR